MGQSLGSKSFVMVFMHIGISVVIFKVDKTLACPCAEGNDPAAVGKLMM